MTEYWVNFKTGICWPLCWAVFWTGHLACKVMYLAWETECWVDFWYPVYNWLMRQSLNLQKWAGDPSHYPWDKESDGNEIRQDPVDKTAE